VAAGGNGVFGFIGSDVTADAFTATNLGPDMGGTFTVNAENKQLTFHATAVPEPTTYILLGILLLTARHRRRNVQS
jgi:hypothetical protein